MEVWWIPLMFFAKRKGGGVLPAGAVLQWQRQWALQQGLLAGGKARLSLGLPKLRDVTCSACASLALQKVCSGPNWSMSHCSVPCWDQPERTAPLPCASGARFTSCRYVGRQVRCLSSCVCNIENLQYWEQIGWKVGSHLSAREL